MALTPRIIATGSGDVVYLDTTFSLLGFEEKLLEKIGKIEGIDSEYPSTVAKNRLTAYKLAAAFWIEDGILNDIFRMVEGVTGVRPEIVNKVSDGVDS